MIFTCGQVQDLNKTSPLSLKKYQKHLFYQLEVSPYNFPLCIAKSTTPVSVQLCSFFLYCLSSPRRVCKPARGQSSSACSKADSCDCDIVGRHKGACLWQSFSSIIAPRIKSATYTQNFTVICCPPVNVRSFQLYAMLSYSNCLQAWALYQT